MKIKLVKEVTILGSVFRMIYDKTHGGGAFSCGESTIKIGVKNIKNDPLWVMGIISHEVMEVIMVSTGCRYDNSRLQDSDYLFSFNHQKFENAIQIHTEIMSKFYA